MNSTSGKCVNGKLSSELHSLRKQPDELFIDTVKRIGVEPFRERVYAAR